MKRSEIQLVAKILNMVRREKNSPLAAYCTVTTLATAFEPMRLCEIRAILDDPQFGTGTVERLVEKGQISSSKSADGKTQYVITPIGMQEVKRIVRGTVSRPNPSKDDIKRNLVAFKPSQKAS